MSSCTFSTVVLKVLERTAMKPPKPSARPLMVSFLSSLMRVLAVLRVPCTRPSTLQNREWNFCMFFLRISLIFAEK